MEYWIIIDNKHAGPYSATQLIDAGLTPETLVWHEGLADWAKAGEVPELAAEMQRAQLMDAEARSENDVEAAEDDATVEAYNEAYAAPQQASTVTDWLIILYYHLRFCNGLAPVYLVETATVIL